MSAIATLTEPQPTTPHQSLLPEGWVRPKGYSNGIAAQGRFVLTGGVVGWNAQEEFVAKDFVGQFRQCLENIKAILAEGGARPEHVVRLTWYITSRAEYHASLRDVGAVYREVMGRVYPAMAVVEVSGLMEPTAKIEIEATAIIPTA
jgi:enamine deaminase RidA (YjgF/YER057c/UK114 family)